MDAQARIATLMLHGVSMWTRPGTSRYRALCVKRGEMPALTYSRMIPGNIEEGRFVWRLHEAMKPFNLFAPQPCEFGARLIELIPEELFLKFLSLITTD